MVCPTCRGFGTKVRNDRRRGFVSVRDCPACHGSGFICPVPACGMSARHGRPACDLHWRELVPVEWRTRFLRIEPKSEARRALVAEIVRLLSAVQPLTHSTI